MMPLRNMKPAEAKAIFRPLVVKMLSAVAIAKREKMIVDARYAPIFIKYNFYNDLEVSHGKPRERITNRKDLFLSQDAESCASYYAECDAANRAAGFTGPNDCCPALMAQTAVIKAENELIAAAVPLMGLKDDSGIYGDVRARLLDLLTALAVGESQPRARARK